MKKYDFDYMEDDNNIINPNIINDNIQVNKINNYFYSNYNMIESKFNRKIKNNDLFKEYSTPYIVCLKDDAEYKPYFSEYELTLEQYNCMKSSIQIIPTNYRMLHDLAYKYLTIISSDVFNSFLVYDNFGKKITVSSSVLVCSLLRFKYTNIKRYLMQFCGLTTFIDLYNLLIINEYLGQINKKSLNVDNIKNIISNFDESNYYTNYNNCQLNITNAFKERAMTIELHEKNIDQKIKKILNNQDKEEEDYLANVFKKGNYLDASRALSNNEYKLYKINNTPLINVITNDNFNTLYDKLPTFKLKYYMIMNCLISKNLCHFIINNKYILNEIMSDAKDTKDLTFMNKYSSLLRYYLGYAMFTFYIEACIKKTYITEKDRFVFDTDVSSCLPYYGYSNENISICPYLPVIINNDDVNISKNILSFVPHFFEPLPVLGSTIHTIRTNNNCVKYGVAPTEKIINRINIFMSGKNQNNISILDGFDWSNIAMTGSIMACCLPNFNPLMINYMLDSSMNIDFAAFANEYYKDADIDMMCNIKNIYEYVDKVNYIRDTIENNLIKINNLNVTSDESTSVLDLRITTLYSNKTAAIMINKDFIKTNLCNKIKMSLDDIITNLNSTEIKMIIYTHYINWHKTFLEKELRSDYKRFINQKYNDLYTMVPIDNINIILSKTRKDIEEQKQEYKEKHNKLKKRYNNLEDSDDEDNDFEDKEYEYIDPDNKYDTNKYENNNLFEVKINYKFRISSRYLPHHFELFQVKYNEFFATVSRFHLPIVRAYYNGKSIKQLPESMFACMTLLNIDYKYFASNKHPFEIINKYRRRGFGTILNDDEIKKLITYSKNTEKWNKLYNRSKIIGSYNINFTNVGLFQHINSSDSDNKKYLPLSDIRYTAKPFNVNDYSIYNSDRGDHYKYYYKLDALDLKKYYTINNKGSINTVTKWLIDAVYDAFK